jgi:hypothetical protein
MKGGNPDSWNNIKKEKGEQGINHCRKEILPPFDRATINSVSSFPVKSFPSKTTRENA